MSATGEGDGSGEAGKGQASSLGVGMREGTNLGPVLTVSLNSRPSK